MGVLEKGAYLWKGFVQGGSMTGKFRCIRVKPQLGVRVHRRPQRRLMGSHPRDILGLHLSVTVEGIWVTERGAQGQGCGCVHHGGRERGNS